jgi:predicted porin
MKPSPIALGLLAAAATLSMATPALAQSSVTIAGIVDAAARHVSNAGLGSVSSLISGGNSTSRLIVRGHEDLGDGWSASFHLEHGLLLDTGSQAATAAFWDRRSTISLASRTLGELRLGRDYVPSYVNWVRYDPFSHVGVAGSNNLTTGSQAGPVRNAFNTGQNTTVRSSNAIELLLPGGLSGLEGGLMVAAGEGGTAANGQGKVVGGRLGWAGGPVVVTVAVTVTENDRTIDAEFTDAVVGGSWNLGAVRLSAAWRRYEQADAAQTNLMLAAVVPVGLGDIKLSAVQADMSGRVGATTIDGNGALQLGLGYVHNLSKRTALYGTVSRIDNAGASTFVVPGGAPGMAGGQSSTGVEAGIKHSF